jgi:2'-5' RNA ligase
MRIFAALPPSQVFLDALEEALVPLKAAYPRLRWLPRENLHITLAFLGELDKFSVTLLNEAAAETAARVKPVTASTGKLRSFPQGKPAASLALGIAQGGARVSSLASFFEQNLVRAAQSYGCQFRRETRVFTPHLTIARKGAAPMTIFPHDKDAGIHIAGVFDRVTIFQSELYKDGAFYTPIAEYAFEENAE